MKFSIFDTDNWREIGATLARNKTRTFLTAFGIFWGTAMLAMLHGGALGLRGMLFREIEGFSANTGGVFPGTTSLPYNGMQKDRSWNFTLRDCEALRETSPALESLSPIISRYGTAAYGDKSRGTSIMGAAPQFYSIQTVELLAGRVLNESDQRAKARNVVIGSEVSADLFGSDPAFAIGKFITINGLAYRVVGVAKQISEASIMGRVEQMVTLPVSTMAATYNTGNSVDIIIFTAKDQHTPKEVFKDIRNIARRNHSVSPDDPKAFNEIDVSEMFKNIGMVFTGIDLLAIFVGFGSLIAGIIGVGNIMWIIVRERTNEIGIRRAIGAKPRDIIAQILSESMVLTVIAGTAGIVFGSLVLFIADFVTADPTLGHAGFQLQFGTAIIILLVFLSLGTLAGLIPALKAMRIKPVEAMRGK